MTYSEWIDTIYSHLTDEKKLTLNYVSRWKILTKYIHASSEIQTQDIS